jgi:putative two-component system response regulator
MQAATLHTARILIVDDLDLNVHLLERILKLEGYCQIRVTTDPRQALILIETFQPDLLLLDLHMPVMDGFAVMAALGQHTSGGIYMPILAITGDITPETKLRALSAGARDFVSKPFDNTEVLLRIKNLLETRFLYLQLQHQNLALEAKVRERTRELEQAQVEILQRLALAAEFRDDATGQHTQRVGQLAADLASVLGLPEDQVELIRLTAPLHDLGKIGIPDSILLKPDVLSCDEMEQMRSHAAIGARILSGGTHALLQMAEEIAHTHHERWDGSGYPRGIVGEAIPLTGRIVAVADAVDALLHERPYKRAWPVADVLNEIARQSGDKFDPCVVEALLRLYGQTAAAADQHELMIEALSEALAVAGHSA